MELNNGIWNQMWELEPAQLKPLTMKDLTEALMKTQVKSVSYNSIYIGSDMYDIFWDIMYEKNSINIYGIKQISKQGKLFVYEGVLFDKFPDNYDLLYISHGNRFNSENIEEIELLELTDTKIVFKCSVKIPEGKDGIILQWN